MNYIKKLSELDRTDLALAGGKGANLGALIRAGLPVPEGFCVTTPAYLWFVEANSLQAQIDRLVEKVHPEDPRELDEASTAIRALFEGQSVPREVTDEILSAYLMLPGQNGTGAAVAVRSSATAEDLPNLSFAGQQDTYLNVIGADAVIHAVLRCWASLWTARAIGYRLRNGIPNTGIALAVVVQRMVNSEASGVLFTANPLTGKRTETVIDATLGLGEALVSGAVVPDHFEVGLEGEDWRILRKTLGSKSVVIEGMAGGGTQTRQGDASNLQALPDAQILELTKLGKRSEEFFRAPQDMEWGWAEDRLFVLQSRSITSLFPLPEGVPYNPLEVWFSFAAWQGMLDPYSPLGQDVFSNIIVGLGRVFDAKTTARSQSIFREAAMRLFVNVTPLLKSSLGSKVALIFVEAIDPVSSEVVRGLFSDPSLGLKPKPLSLKARLGLIKGFRPVVANVIRFLINPAKGRARLSETIRGLVIQTSEKVERAHTLKEMLIAMQEIAHMAPTFLLPHLLPGVISGQAPFQMILRLTENEPGCEGLGYELARGLPYNVTTEMDLKLWATACAIREDGRSREYFEGHSADELAAAYLSGDLPAAAQQAGREFIDAYGFRGLGEIDVYKPRWFEDPRHVMQIIKNYLQIDPLTGSPEIAFLQGRERASKARQALVQFFKRKQQPLKAALIDFLAGKTFELAGLRETPKFAIVNFLAELRKGMLRIGDEMVARGELRQRDDLFFLHLWELDRLAEGNLPHALQLICERRETYQKELTRKRIPRVMLSDGTAFFDGIGNKLGDGTLSGAPVSPGTVEGLVRVILDPHQDHLAHGEILVCPATDPAWTPLFLSAGGLVMEVGGMMTHGSVVAREYGIPAVVGVVGCTTILKTGQRIRVDGSSGVVTLLEDGN